MNEEQPRGGDEEIEPMLAPLKGPNVVSTFDTPPSADAIRAQDASIRRHLRDHRPPGQESPGE